MLITAFLILLLIAGGVVGYRWLSNSHRGDTYEVERTDYHAPPPPADDVLPDDRMEDKHVPPFDPTLVDRRAVGGQGDWLLNASNAVIQLDVPLVRPDVEGDLLTLHPSYAAAASARTPPDRAVLPSVNMLDGKAKQFDDGLYAALDQAHYQGVRDKLTSHVQLVRRIYDKAGPADPAAAYLAAGLELAGVQVAVDDAGAKDRLLQAFRENEVASKPIGFYTWNKTLADCFRFVRFFQKEFGPGELTVPAALAQVLGKDPGLRSDYGKAVRFYARLTNPLACLAVTDLPADHPPDADAFTQLCRDRHVMHTAVALFPPSSSRETVLFEKLFPLGIPENVNLMHELVRRIRSGEVNLKPGPDSGWYDYQVYALETLLLPEKGEEHNKLLLTKAYKKRMLEAFQALVTKRRETHVRQLAMAKAAAAGPPPSKVEPRLRVEPCPSYYLRTARAYAFLANFLDAALGKSALEGLHGLTEKGPRGPNLRAELLGMRDLFYGLYLVSCEDIGLKPAFAPGEVADAEACYRQAAGWLPKAFADPDLAADTRVAVPVAVDPHGTRLWVTLGVRLSKLDAAYARAPSMKPARGKGEWQPVDFDRLAASRYLIPVDEFAEVSLPGPRVLTREELRAVCDRERTKEAIMEALRR
jgi:hypothetical protein